MSAGFPAGKANGHHLINRSPHPAVYLEIGDRTAGDQAFYSSADLEAHAEAKTVFTHRGGKPY
jgi:uncharacterized cupin superfamily protein